MEFHGGNRRRSTVVTAKQPPKQSVKIRANMSARRAASKSTKQNDEKESTGKSASIKLYYQQKRSNNNQTTKKPAKKLSDPLASTKKDEPAESNIESEEFNNDNTFPEELVALVKRHCKRNASKVLNQFATKFEKFRTDLKVSELDRNSFDNLLLRIISAEDRRLSSTTDFSAWLGNPVFVESLVACYLVHEGVAKAAELEDLASLFDIVMLIEMVIRHMPRSEVKRLKSWEEQILLSAVWAEPTIHNLIESDRKQIIDKEKKRLLESPRKAIRAMTNEASSDGRLSRLDLFFRKYFRLVVRLLDSLAEKLSLGEDLQDCLWKAVLGLVEQVEPEQQLLRNRHLGQVLAALTYSVCKFYDKPITFKQIISALDDTIKYGKSKDMYKQIWMGEGEERADLVTFYNRIFLPAMQHVIHTLPPLAGPEIATVPASPRTPRRKNSLLEEEHWPPQPSLHSPIMATSHLSKRVQLDMSPLKRSLSRHIPSGTTPTKLSLASTTADSIISMEGGAESSVADKTKPAVSRCLDF